MTERTLKQDLTDARLLITPREKWTQGAFARTAAGTRTGALMPEAVKWDASGAIIRVAGENADSVIEYVLSFITTFRYLTSFNDHSTHDDVLRVLDLAIAAAAARVSDEVQA